MFVRFCGSNCAILRITSYDIEDIKGASHISILAKAQAKLAIPCGKNELILGIDCEEIDENRGTSQQHILENAHTVLDRFCWANS